MKYYSKSFLLTISIGTTIGIILLIKLFQEPQYINNHDANTLILHHSLDDYLSDIKLDNVFPNNDEKQILNLLNKNTVSDFCIITVSNYGFRDLTLNWIISLKKQNFVKFVIFSFDQELLYFLSQKDYGDQSVLVPRSWLNLPIKQDPAAFETENYHAIVQGKSNIFSKLLLFNQKFLFSDVDCVMIGRGIVDYINVLMHHSNAHMIFAQDFEPNKPYYNTGFFYETPTNFTKKLYSKLTQSQLLDKNSIDQHVLDRLLLKIRHNDNRLETFDIFAIANGDLYFTKELHLKVSLKPLVVHANYFPSRETKIQALKSKKLWYLEDKD